LSIDEETKEDDKTTSDVSPANTDEYSWTKEKIK
jgi:hypothetical protein